MSVPSIDIICDRCGYSGSTGIAHGIFKYQTPFGKITVPRTLGWCNSCRSLAPIEDSDQISRYKSLKGDMADLEASLAEEIEKEKRSLPILEWLFSSREPDTEVIRELRVRLANYGQELATPSALASYLMSIGDAHCLSCGAPDVFRLPKLPTGLDDFYSEDRTAVATGVEHPGCGGELYAATSRVRLNRRFSEKLYSLNGKRIA